MIPKELLKALRKIEITTNRLATEQLSANYVSVFKGQGLAFSEVREYQPGDDVRSIDWNVSARMNNAYVKVFVEEREMTVMLVVDLSASQHFGTRVANKTRLAAEVAALCAFSAIKHNDRVGLIMTTDQVEKIVPPKKGQKHVMRVVREIMGANPERTGTPMRTRAFGEEAPGTLLESTEVALRSIDVLLSNETGLIVDIRRDDPLADGIL